MTERSERQAIAHEREVTRAASNLNGHTPSVPRWLMTSVVIAFAFLLALIVWSLVGLDRAGAARAALACRSDLVSRATIADVAEQLDASPLDPLDFTGEVRRYARAHNLRTARLVEETVGALEQQPASCEGLRVIVVDGD